MSVSKFVGQAVKGSVGTAVTVARHPIGTAAHAVGLAKGVAELGVEVGVGVVRGLTGHGAPAQAPSDVAARTQEVVEDAVETVEEAVEETAAPRESAEQDQTEQPVDPRDELPGPDLAPVPMTDAADLPEPVVITAEDEPGEEFHTEPKAASRVSEHEGLPGDREEATGYVEELPEDVSLSDRPL